MECEDGKEIMVGINANDIIISDTTKQTQKCSHMVKTTSLSLPTSHHSHP